MDSKTQEKASTEDQHLGSMRTRTRSSTKNPAALRGRKTRRRDATAKPPSSLRKYAFGVLLRAEQANEREWKGGIPSVTTGVNLVAAEVRCCREAGGE
jgi:hypothetical protein